MLKLDAAGWLPVACMQQRPDERRKYPFKVGMPRKFECSSNAATNSLCMTRLMCILLYCNYIGNLVRQGFGAMMMW